MMLRLNRRLGWCASVVGVCLWASAVPVARSCQENGAVDEVTGAAATFRLCGTSDPAAERAIEQAVAGRAFNAILVGRPDGCADLTIEATSPAAVNPGSRVQSTLTMSLDAGRAVSVQIVSEDGATRVSVGP